MNKYLAVVLLIVLLAGTALSIAAFNKVVYCAFNDPRRACYYD